MRLALLAAFVAGGAAMALEVAGVRVVAPYVGVSLHTWTSVIGVVLAGLALGGWLGGRLADRLPARAVMGGALLLGALAAAAVAPLAESRPTPPFVDPRDPLIRAAWLALSLFLAPSLALGAVPPAAARLALGDAGRTGRVVGALQAASALGGIAGTFLAGFAAIDALGSRGTVAAAAAALALLSAGVLVGPMAGAPAARRLAGAGLCALVAAPLGLALAGAAPLTGPCTRESAYFCIDVRTRPGLRGPVKALVLDRLVHGYGSAEDPTHLEYGYLRAFAAVTAGQLGDRPALRALFVGGGGYTLPRYLEARYPSARIEVVEIDPRVTEVAQAYLGLRRDGAIRTHSRDARQFFLERRPTAAYDVVYGDAFNDVAVPYHLTTREFAAMVRRALAPDGLYLANVIDLHPRGGFVTAYLATLAAEFPHVALLVEQRDDGPADGPARATFVVVASAAPLDLKRLAAPPTHFPLGPGPLAAYLAAGAPKVLTDDHAPVEGLTAPLFLARS
jgi:hypothetical protein